MAQRVVRLSWRPARIEDAALLLEWRNDPATRAASLTTHEISLDEHVRWLTGRLQSTSTRLHILLDDAQQPIGQVRFEFDREGRAEVNIGLSAAARGRGYASEALQRLGDELLGQAGVHTLVAVVKAGNDASIRAFSRAGFAREGVRLVNGQSVIVMVRHREDRRE